MASTSRLLVVSPDDALLRQAARCIVTLGYEPLAAKSVADARRLFRRGAPAEAVCVDGSIPQDELDRFCRWLSSSRRRAAATILMLCHERSTARLAPEAAGVVTLPLRPRALAKELERAAGRRARREWTAGGMTLAREGPELRLHEGPAVRLTPTEFRLLRYLFERAGEYVPVPQLLTDVWGYPPGMGGGEVVRTHVANVRRKLRTAGADTTSIRSLPYEGYAVAPEVGGKRRRR